MGGRVAEEISFGKDNVTSGASSDIQQATRLARSMVTKYGLSDKIGAVFINNDPSQNDRGTAISNDTLLAVDAEIKRLCDESYARVSKLLTENKHKLENIANGLIKYETLSGAEVVEMANTGQLVSEREGVVRSQKPSRELKEIPIDRKKRDPLFFPPSPSPVPVPARTPVTHRERVPPTPTTSAPTSSSNASNANSAKTPSPSPLSDIASWFSSNFAAPKQESPPATVTDGAPGKFTAPGVVPPPAAVSPGSKPPTTANPHTQTSVEVIQRNINGVLVEDRKTTVVTRNPQTGAVTTSTTTRRVRGPPVIVDAETNKKPTAAPTTPEASSNSDEPKSPKK
jgi:hypothetical protein